MVSKLRENAKQVIGVGVKHSTSDLLVANCDEFIFYDDLVRDSSRNGKRDSKDARDNRDAASGQRRASNDDDRRRKHDKNDKDDLEARRSKAIAMVVETFDALMAERGDTGKIWASVVKQTLKRRRPDFNESYFGFKAFGNLLDEAQRRGLLETGRDEKSGTYVYRPGGLDDESESVSGRSGEQPSALNAKGRDSSAAGKTVSDDIVSATVSEASIDAGSRADAGAGSSKKGAARKTRGGRKASKADVAVVAGKKDDVVDESARVDSNNAETDVVDIASSNAYSGDASSQPVTTNDASPVKPAARSRGKGTGGRKASATRKAAVDAVPSAESDAVGGAEAGQGQLVADHAADVADPAAPAKKKAARKTAARPRRARKTVDASGAEKGEPQAS